ncbi:MAG: efflux transporter outer membrane subunit [Pseudomonadota bacterium]
MARRSAKAVVLIAPWFLASCALQSPPAAVEGGAPSRWFAAAPGPSTLEPGPAALPHQGSLAGLGQWWRQQGDPLLVELIDAAQQASPTVASAYSRLEQARATRVAAAAALLPSLDASASTSRSRSQQPGAPAATLTSSQAGLQAAWEVDVFGGNAASRNAASERLAGAQAQWHDARVSVAAEVALQYYGLRSCRQLAGITAADAGSRRETARLSELSMQAGFTAPATAGLARASSAEASGRATQQAAQCEIDLKALVALTGVSEPELRQKLLASSAGLKVAAPLALPLLPAEVLAQRPDLFSAAREVAAASADVGSADAERYPRLGLNGSIGVSNLRIGGVSSNLSTWSIGPLSLSLPLFDGGRRSANVEAAKARYDEAAALYRAKVRQAVREVEESLVNLQSTAARSDDATAAVAGYQSSFIGTEARYRAGLASLVELEDARRLLLASQITQASLQRERLAAWVGLYRAAGGGWSQNTEAAIARANLPPGP